MSPRRRLTVFLAAALAAAVLPAAAGAETPDAVEDDLLQIAVNRVAAEASAFGSFRPCPDLGGTCDASRNVAITVIDLDTGHVVSVNGGIWEISASAAKAYWVAAAVEDLGWKPVAADAKRIFQYSDNTAASRVIDLIAANQGGPMATAGVDRINQLTRSWGLDDTFFRGWYGDRHSTETPYPWGYRNITTTDELALFWAAIDSGTILTGADLTNFMAWASTDRLQGNELIVPRLPSNVTAHYKSGWLYGITSNPSYRRISGALIETPSGSRFAIAIAFQASTSGTFYSSGIEWARYASCEIYNVVAEAHANCARSGDPSAVVNDTTTPIGKLSTVKVKKGQPIVKGWALDRDSGADPIDVRITVDGTAIGAVTADRLKTSINDRYGLGNYHRFDQRLKVPLGAGTHRVCAYAQNDGAGSDTLIGCKTVTVEQADYFQPNGALTSATVDGTLIIAQGWARDRDTLGAIQVEVTLDGEMLGVVNANRGANGHRFKLRTYRALDPGDYEVCATALNFGGSNPDRAIGCLTITVP